MDAPTAGIALIIVQFCIALVMAGVYLTARDEKCTRYWSMAAVMLAVGVFCAILNKRAYHPATVLISAGAVMTGLVLQWHGIKAFYKQRIAWTGWLLVVAIFIAMSIGLWLGANLLQRFFIALPLLMIGELCSLLAIWRGQGGPPRTFVQTLAPAALIILLLNNTIRLVLYGLHLAGSLEIQEYATLETFAALIAPIAGVLLYSIGLLLLYFERMIEENHHLATHDELSSLLNRRAIDAAGERELALSSRLKRELAIAFIDIDMFKHFNDQFGHASGDIVITDVATILRETCRSIDLVGRYGGEEFLLVLPGVGHEDAETIGQRLVEAMHRYRFLGIHPVTISVGLAILPADACSWDQLIRRADAALYEAKSLGRNRYCV